MRWSSRSRVLPKCHESPASVEKRLKLTRTAKALTSVGHVATLRPHAREFERGRTFTLARGPHAEGRSLKKVVIHLIAAARPNFMKVAPLYHALSAQPWCEPKIVHTGQHYDANMSDAFFRDLRLPAPAHHLEVGSGSHAEQTGRTMMAYESRVRARTARRHHRGG